MSLTDRSLHISISQLPSPEGVNDYLRLVTHVATDGGALEVAPRRHAPTEWKGRCTLEGIVHQVFGPTVDDVLHQLADRVGAI